MPVIVSGGGGTRVVIAEKRRTASTVAVKPIGVELPDRRSVATAKDNAKILPVASPGPQGPQGEPGRDGADGGAPATLSYVNGEHFTLGRGTPLSVHMGVFRRATCRDPLDDVVGLLLDETLVEGAAGRAQIGGSMVLTPLEWDAVTGMVGGLAPEQSYFLTASGLLSPYPPTSAGDTVVPVGYAVSSTEFVIEVGTPVRL